MLLRLISLKSLPEGQFLIPQIAFITIQAVAKALGPLSLAAATLPSES